MLQILKMMELLVTEAMINIVIHAVPRFIWNLSIRTATSVSSSEMEEVSAASNTKIKNTAAITLEKAILLNTFGSITNIKDGPFASMDESPFENTNTAGTIISLQGKQPLYQKSQPV